MYINRNDKIYFLIGLSSIIAFSAFAGCVFTLLLIRLGFVHVPPIG